MGDSHKIMMVKKLIEDGPEEKGAVIPQELPDTFSIYLSLHPTCLAVVFAESTERIIKHINSLTVLEGQKENCIT